ncbi:non-receptor serine/threonine protein kinase [Lithospermum erythrorhizon]|uniref:Non-receptor serine/threonine protein kinase n=1 Tax=Lithospermum erythrorhizon TaxID=34254 RepID=A0AAV3NXK7_LITER
MDVGPSRAASAPVAVIEDLQHREGDLEGIKELLDSGTDVNFKDIDNRTALHVAACQWYIDVVQFLLQNGAKVDPKDRWGSTPLADSIHYNNHDVIKLLERHGAQPLVAPMHVKNAREVPEYEIDPKELDFTNSKAITKVLELAGNAAKDNKRTMIIPRHVLLAVRNDEELGKLLAGVTIAHGGVIPNTNPVLLPKKYERAAKEVAKSPIKA